ncbi:MAG: YncE family protein [Betaproteobacteria bacterium]|nr:YncE family protein [Betaproteobacteria bacterium]
MAMAAPFAYITNHGGSTVSVLDTATNTVITTITVGLHPYGVAVNAAGSRAYVTNEGSHNVSVINTATNTVIATVPVGVTPEGVAVNPAGTRVYVTNWNSDTVSVIDATTNTVIATVAVGRCPGGVAVNPAGTTVRDERMRQLLSRFERQGVGDRRRDQHRDDVDPGGQGPEGVVVNPAGTLVYVVNGLYGGSNGNVSVIDAASNTVTAAISVGVGAEGVVIDPTGTTLYVANRGPGTGSALGTVSVIDTASEAETMAIPVGLRPVGVAINPAGTLVYVADEGHANVMAIDTATNAVVGLPVTVGSGPRAYGRFIGPAGTTLDASLDVDASFAPSKYDALTDGLIILRYLFGLTGPALTSNALGAAATRTNPAVIKSYLDGIRPSLDVDGNLNADALTDGLLILRYMFGLRGPSLIAGAFDPTGSRTDATEIAAYIQSLMPE